MVDSGKEISGGGWLGTTDFEKQNSDGEQRGSILPPDPVPSEAAQALMPLIQGCQWSGPCLALL